jgi:spore germination protein GerM
MRRTVIVLTCVLLLLCMGCAPAADEGAVIDQMSAMSPQIIYYPSDNGYVVPTVRNLAAVSPQHIADELLYTSENLTLLSGHGLTPALNDGAEVNVAVVNGAATVKLSHFKPASLEQEELALTCLSASLLELDTVNSVQFKLMDAEEQATATVFGTDLSEPLNAYMLNGENDPSSKSASAVTLYFIDIETGHIVPVTRYITAKPDANNVMFEYQAGPLNSKTLVSGLPEGAQINTFELKDGVATIDFNQKFENLMENPALEQSVLSAIALTCEQFEDVESVRVMVEGQQYEEPALSTFTTIP